MAQASQVVALNSSDRTRTLRSSRNMAQSSTPIARSLPGPAAGLQRRRMLEVRIVRNVVRSRSNAPTPRTVQPQLAMIQPSDLVRLRHLHQVVARAEAALARAEAALAREKAALEHAKVETEHLKQENAERKVALKQQLARMEQYNECRKLYEKKIAFIARTAGEGAVSLQKFHKSLEEHRKLREQRLDTLRGVLAKFSGQVPTGREA